jgi:hypothetical protein
LGSLNACVASRSSIGAGRFFRNPDFQFRDFGASAPDVSFNQNVASSFATHPVIVTDVTVRPATFDVDSIAAAFGTVVSVFGALDTGSAAATLASADPAFSTDVSAPDARTTAAVGLDGTLFLVSSRVVAAAGSVDTLAADRAAATGGALGFGGAISSGGMALGGALMLATSGCWDGCRAAISTAAAMTQIAPANTARGVSARTTLASVIGAALVGRIVGRRDRVAFLAFLAFFAGTDILLSESR